MATHNNIKILLKNRVGFHIPLDSSFDVLSTDNKQSDSGLFFQDAHTIITLENIRDTQSVENISDDKFNEYLKNLRESNVLSMLQDVFKGNSTIDESDLSVFDNAIYLRMVLKVGEIILTSSRTNTIERFSKTVLTNLRLDLQGSNDNKGYKNPNLPYHLGYTTRYRTEVEILKSIFNNREAGILQTVTLG